MRSIGLTLLTLVAACSFDRSGLGPGEGPDAARIDAAAIDGPTTDADPNAPDASPDATVLLIDASPDACVPLPMELCNGVDDTCEGTIDEGYDLVTPCDGADTDFCTDDMPVCAPGFLSVACSVGDDDTETCNGADDDCDGTNDDGFNVGSPCDGADSDLCQEGVFACNGSGGSDCNDATSSTTETCNGADDDCDGMMDEDFTTLGDPCDGGDGDMCQEGFFACDGGGGVSCSDATSTSTELCNTGDDDCDGMIDEGFDLAGDESNCGTCGTMCTNAFGTNTCLTGTCTPVCVGAGAMNCDGNANNGCEIRNTNPVCTTAIVDLGDITADDGTTPATFPFTATAMGYTEAWYRVTIAETVSGGGGNLEAQIDLVVPPNVDYDLYLYCADCGAGAAIDSSTGGTGADEQVTVRRTDGTASQNFDVIIEIRHFSIAGEACGDWQLTVTGNVAVGGGAPVCP